MVGSSESSKPFKQCTRCKAWSTSNGFNAAPRNADGKHGYCARCCCIGRTFKRTLAKIKTIALYGGRCSCCGEIRPEFLSLDHIFGGGRAERDQRREEGKEPNNQHHYERIAKSGVQDSRFRILCHNCNQVYGIFGHCPHEDLDQCAA